MHLVRVTRKLLRNISEARSEMGATLRKVLTSPPGVGGSEGGSGSDPYPLPITPECKEALWHFATYRSNTTALDPQSLQGRLKGKDSWGLLAHAWCGMMVIGLNTSRCFTTTATTHVRSPLKKRVLECLLSDAVSFVKGDGLSKGVPRRPEVPWSSRISDLTVSYGGEVVEKARWLTLRQIEPGLPPLGKGGLLFAPDFCDGWVSKHLLDAELSRKSDSDVISPLPFAVVRSTQAEWDSIAIELVKRGVARVIEPQDIATFQGQPILNGAFGVAKPNKWVGDPKNNCPVLRLIMDFRAANVVHRMLPGSVSSLVGAAKWQAFCLEKGEVLVASGDDLVAAFYLFRLPFSWSRYFTFRKPVRRKTLGLGGDPEAEVFIASQVLPMGWAAAVTIMQHMHRRMALSQQVLPVEREIHRERPLPEKSTRACSAYWNLYVDDLTIIEMVSESWLERQGLEGGSNKSPLQEQMEMAYSTLGVPFSEEKATIREACCEKLGAYINGRTGKLGITTSRALDFITLVLYLASSERLPTRWVQVVLGKFVHIVQFRRPMFSMVELAWKRLHNFHSANPMSAGELDEFMTLCMCLPLAYSDLRAKVLSMVTCSDASPSGGGLCYSTGLSPLGQLSCWMSRDVVRPEEVNFVTFEWFAGIGGMSRSLERLGLRTHQAVVCECDPICVAILRNYLPGCEVWKDIRKVTEEDIRLFLDRFPDARGIIQSGGSPCQGLSKLSSQRLHFEDERSGLFFELIRVQSIVVREAERRGWWHLGFVENVVCDEADQEVFRTETQWDQWLLCSGSLSHVKRPRFFWVSSSLDFSDCAQVEPGPGYRVAHLLGPKEDPWWWVSPGWKWSSESNPVSLPTFTRAIPRVKPPVHPAGIKSTPEDAKVRWYEDWYRYPPYTYRYENCMIKEPFIRVACSSEREALMGFGPGHTKLRKKTVTEDERCAMIGNSFHTGVVAMLLRGGLVGQFPFLKEVTTTSLLNDLEAEWGKAQREVYLGESHSSINESDETWLDRLEQQSLSVEPPPGTITTPMLLASKLLDLSSFRGTDLHMDTTTFFRPDRLPRSSIDSRQWVWKIARGWKWNFSDHINVLEMEALYHALRWRGKTLRLFHTRFVHLVDSQVVLGVAAKGRTSSKRLRKSLHKYNLLVLALHTYPLLGWVLSHLNPSDAPSRWFEEQPS